jgi:hypothetical protein
MTTTGKNLVADFERLPDAEKQEVLADILRISAHLPYAAPAEDELVAAADAIFREYDAREADR